jgi:hypothetical protein
MAINSDIKSLLGQIIVKQDHAQTQIQDLDKKVDILLQQQIPALQVEIAMLKVRSGLWGGIAGLVPVVVSYLVEHLS